MKPIEIAREVLDRSGAMVARPRKNAPGQYDAKPWATGNHRGWVLLDATTAGAMVAVYDAIGPDAQAKYDTFDLLRAVDISWKVLARANGGAR